MKQPHDLAQRYLLIADRDINTMTLLAKIAESDDEAIGFHAQQAVEKCLKAVLSLHQIPFRKTHDLGELMDLLSDAGKPTPPETNEIEFLNPFAVTFRYDLIDLETFDRNHATALVVKVRHWVATQIP
ncbi:MAG: HEPN domain-containing protein [Nitrospirota bacterium]|nr:HEPN domain-containing protein [Nitrospirota bacterium]MDH5775594.1 HEPN domain-containing protein [Nitrospirota bacterium]